MGDRYQPTSDFLQAIIDEEVPLSGGEHARANLCRLVEMTRDEDVTNRDWATLLLAQQDLDTPDIRGALLAAANDENEFVRAEAILGLAQRDKSVALPFLKQALAGDSVAYAIFEAAVLVADISLVEQLRLYASPSGNEGIDGVAIDALEACETGQPTSA